jgi:hypothetical protein
MRNGVIATTIVVSVLAACHRQPEPTYEYGETVTYTSTADDPAPQQVNPTVGAPAPPTAPASGGTSTSAEAVPLADAAVERDGAWTATVQTGSSPTATPAAPDDPAEEGGSGASAPTTAPAADAPDPDAPATVSPGRWYKARPW